MSAGPGRARVWAALLTVYVVWGSTYLGILLATRTLPVFLMSTIRFLAAGALLYLWSIRRGDRSDRPTLRHWRSAAVIGFGLLFVGNNFVALAERCVDTGVSSLVIATVPLWLAVFDRLFWGQRLSRTSVAGLALGFGGAALLGGPGKGHIDWLGALTLAVGAAVWALTSLYSRKAPLPARPLVGASMEMLLGGAMLGLASLALGDPWHVHHVSTETLLALAYLIVIGSLVAFTSYVWLLRNARTSLVSTYAYVNPGVAVLLGWWVENEQIGPRTLAAGAMIVSAVALIVSAPAHARPVPAVAPARGR